MEHNRQRFDDTLTGKVIKLWPLILSFVTIVAIATTFKDKLDNHENRLVKVEKVIDSIDGKIDRLVYELVDKKKAREIEGDDGE